MALGRNNLPPDEKKIRIDPFIQKKVVDLIGKKECEIIAVKAVLKEYNKIKK